MSEFLKLQSRLEESVTADYFQLMRYVWGGSDAMKRRGSVMCDVACDAICVMWYV